MDSFDQREISHQKKELAVEHKKNLLKLYMGFIDRVPLNRITQSSRHYPRYKAQGSFFDAVKHEFELIAKAGIFEDRSVVQDYINEIEIIQKRMRELSFEPTNEPMPEAMRRGITDRIQSGIEPEDAVKEFLSAATRAKDPETLEYLFRSSPKSRIPKEGEAPEDIRRQRQEDIQKINKIIAEVFFRLDQVP